MRSTITRALAWVLVALLLPGCSSWQAVPLREPVPPLPETGKLRLRTSEGKHLSLDHWSLEGDTLRGTHKVWIKGEPIQQPTAFLLRDVTLLDGDLKGDSLRSYLEAHASPVVVPPGAPVAPVSFPTLPEKVRVRLVDGTTVELLNASMDADSLRGVVAPDRHVAIALRDVQSVKHKEVDNGKTVIFIAVCGLLVLAAYFVAYTTSMAYY